MWLTNGLEWTHGQDEDSDGKLDICLLPCDKSFLAFVLQVDSGGLGSTRRSKGVWTRLDSFGLVWTRLDSRQLAVVGAFGLEWTRLDSLFIAVVWAIWTNPV